MRVSSIVVMAIVTISLFGCGVSHSDYEKLKEENGRLASELEDCIYGEARLIAQIEQALDGKIYSEAKEKIELLRVKHPQSEKNVEYERELVRISELELAAKTQAELEEKERIRLANINNTGVWEIRNFRDKFGEVMDRKYIALTNRIYGTFSNTATAHSTLAVDFIIEPPNWHAIMLYEYGGNNPVKSSSRDYYSIHVKDADGIEHELVGRNVSDRLQLDESDSEILHNALKKGGEVKFNIHGSVQSIYNFTISDATFYDNACEKLKQ